MDKLSEEIGYIYCLSNESYKDTYKIGFTKNDPLTRMVQLNTTGMLYPFRLEFAKQVKNYQDKEKKLHLIFDKYRVNKNREFFKIELKEIKQLFDLIDGEWYKLNSPNKEPTKSICKASNISPSSEKTSLTGFKNSTKVEHTYCSRCFDKLNIQQGLIKCKHLDMCNECCNVIKKCPICKVSYNT